METLEDEDDADLLHEGIVEKFNVAHHDGQIPHRDSGHDIRGRPGDID